MSNFVQNENKLPINFNHFISWFRFFLLECRKVIGSTTLCNAIGVRNSRHFFIQSSIVNRSQSFSRARVITLVLLDTQWKSALLQHWYDDNYTNYKIYFIIGPQFAISYCLKPVAKMKSKRFNISRFSEWLLKWLFRVVVLHCLVSKSVWVLIS